MREHKFKCWDSALKCWLNKEDMPLIGEGNDMVFSFSDTETHKFCESTGLNDKSGAEIYELHKVQVGQFYIGDNRVDNIVGTVLFENGGFAIFDDGGDYHCDLCREEIYNYGIKIVGHKFDTQKQP